MAVMPSSRNRRRVEIGTSYLLMGFVREDEGIAAGVLESLGVSLDLARTAVLEAFDRHELLLPQS